MDIKPRTLFLIDGLGALLSAFMLGVVLVTFKSYIGLSNETLYILAFIPVVFSIYDFIVYAINAKNWRPYLKIIAIANLLYCVFSIIVLFTHMDSLKVLGWVYFIAELIIVAILVVYELGVASLKED